MLPQPCRYGCGESVVVAQSVASGRWRPFEARDRTPGSDAAVNCWVLVGPRAWRPGDLADYGVDAWAGGAS